MQKRLMSIILAVMLLAAMATTAGAATYEEINQDAVFVKQSQRGTCTLASTAMMLRRAAMLNGDENWVSITEASCRSAFWLAGRGLPYHFTYGTMTVDHARLPGGQANRQVLIDLLAEHPEAVVIPVKLRDGTVTYDTQTAARDTVTTGGPETLTSLKTLLSGDTWTVARIACFADMDFANAQPDQAGLLRTGDGWLWYDDDAACWLDPGKAAAREYLVQLCKECAELGFDEILLDYCTYPVHGRLDRIDYGSVTNLTDTLSVFVEGVREALPKTTALSVLVRDQVTADANDGGVTLALLTEHFDRIYVDTDTVDAAALQGLLPADFDPVTRLVQVAAEAASSGSYVTR